MGWAESVYTIGQLRKGFIQVTALSGNSVTLTGARTAYTTTVTIPSSGVTYVKVNAPDEYTVNNTTLGYSTTVDCDGNSLAKINVALTTSTWTGIRLIVNAGKTSNYFTVGDTKTITLSTGESVILKVAGIGTYVANDLTFISQSCLTATHQMNTSNTNSGGWNSCALRTWLNNTLYSYLPSDLQSVISSKTLSRSIGNASTTLQSATDNVWLPTEYEMFGSITYSASTEAAVQKQYAEFTSNSSRVKTLGTNGSATYYWGSSPYVGNSANFCYVGTDGSANNAYASNSNGVPLCFQLSPQS